MVVVRFDELPLLLSDLSSSPRLPQLLAQAVSVHLISHPHPHPVFSPLPFSLFHYLTLLNLPP